MKFSYPAKITISSRLPISDRSISDRIATVSSSPRAAKPVGEQADRPVDELDQQQQESGGQTHIERRHEPPAGEQRLLQHTLDHRAPL